MLPDISPLLPDNEIKFIQYSLVTSLTMARPLILQTMPLATYPVWKKNQHKHKRKKWLFTYIPIYHTNSPFRKKQGSVTLLLGSIQVYCHPIQLNGTIHTLCMILKFVAASTAEAELGILFINVQKPNLVRLTTKNLDISNHPCQFMSTKPQQWAVSSVPSNISAFRHWKRDIFGFFMKKHKNRSTLGTKSKNHDAVGNWHAWSYHLCTSTSPRVLLCTPLPHTHTS